MELASLKPSTEAHVNPWHELRREPLLVEPDRQDRARPIANARTDDREPAARTAHAHVFDDSRNGNVVLGEQVDNASLRSDGS